MDLEKGNYALCIFKASKAKANLDIVLSVFYVDEEQMKEILSQKLGIVKRNLIKETQKGIFPILGYSYYEYATVLEERDPYSALLYSEYALELSNLEVYFKEKSKIIEEIKYRINLKSILILISGLIIGYFVGAGIQKQKKKFKKKRKIKKIKR
jgi:predicted S18 family serine protease